MLAVVDLEERALVNRLLHAFGDLTDAAFLLGRADNLACLASLLSAEASGPRARSPYS